MLVEASTAFFLGLICHAAAFNLYPSMNSDKLAKALGISTSCLNALNNTVPCDQTLFQMANEVDSYLWTTENVTDLCTTDCTKSTQNWWSNVIDECASDTLAAYGKLIPAESVAGRYADGLEIACLKSGSVSSKGNTTYNGVWAKNLSAATNASSSSWCLIESQDWQGSDVIRPECTGNSNSTEPQCSDPTDVTPDNERIANLYDNDMLCSDCFLKMFHTRMSSPYLPDHDYSDYLIAQYQDIIDVCNASMPKLEIRAVPYYEVAPINYGAMSGNFSNSSASTTTPYSNSTTDSANNSTNSNTTTCSGRIMNTRDWAANISDCNGIAKQYHVATGDLQRIIGDPFCTPGVGTYCIPAACEIMQVKSQTTCDAIAKILSTTSTPITATQFQNWNPNLNGLCDDLQIGDYVCISPPGGGYTPPPISNSSTSANSQQRGGGDASTSSNSSSNGNLGNSTTSSNTTAPSSSSSPPPASSTSGGKPAAPSPIQSGIAPTCTKYAQVVAGDACAAFAARNGISASDFYTWNPVLGPGGKDCNQQLFKGFYYCVAV